MAIESSAPETAVATRTLLAAGYKITASSRHPNHIEYECERSDTFGASVPYTIVVCDTDQPPAREVQAARVVANHKGRVFLVVAKASGSDWISWTDFVEALGGAVPNWRALGPTYPGVVNSSATNAKPPEVIGEPWQIFEDAIADGLEFLLGHRVRRLGGRRRGRVVSDLLGRTPDDRVIVIDAKASSSPCEVSWPGLRPLVDYVTTQRIRQQGQLEVSGAVLVAARFQQSADRLQELSAQFLADTRVPLSYLQAADLVAMVIELSRRPELRNGIRWRRILCAGGVVSLAVFRDEIQSAGEQRINR